MRSIAAISGVLLLAFLQTAAPAQEPQETKKTQQVVVHLSHFTDDVHRCFMAFKVAGLLQEHGATVTIFVDLEAVRLAERRQLLDMKWSEDSPPLAEYYEKFTEGGGKVVVCPHCAKSARVGAGALKRNAQIATMDSLAELLMGADKIIDY